MIGGTWDSHCKILGSIPGCHPCNFLKAINPFQHGMFLIYDIDIK